MSYLRMRTVIVGLAATAALIVAVPVALAATTFQDLGTGAPPATLGGYTMTAFGDDTRANFTNVSGVVDPAGTISFSIPMNHRSIGGGWATWSHGYTGDVYYSNGATSVTIGLPDDTKAFYVYAEPNPFAIFSFTATTNDGTTSGAVPVNGAAGANGFGFYVTGSSTLETVTISSTVDFAIGEFGIAIDPVPGLLDHLLADSTGVGPGSSLADKVKLAQASYASGDIAATCSKLSAYINEVTAQTGKKIPAATAAHLIAHAQAIKTELGC